MAHNAKRYICAEGGGVEAALRYARVAAVLWISVVGMTTQASAGNGERCEQEWRVESGRAAAETPPSYASLLRRWQDLGPKCAGTVSYEVRKATIHLLLGDVAQARATLKTVAAVPSDYGYLVEFGFLLSDYFEVMNGAISREAVERLEAKFLPFVRKHPAFADAQGILGGIQSVLGKHVEAIGHLEIARKTIMNASGVYQNLTVCYAAVGKYDEAVRASDEAYRRDDGVMANPRFVYAAAVAHAGVGKFYTAALLLRVVAAKLPEVRKDPEFGKAVEFVTARIQRAKKTAEKK